MNTPSPAWGPLVALALIGALPSPPAVAAVPPGLGASPPGDETRPIVTAVPTPPAPSEPLIAPPAPGGLTADEAARLAARTSIDARGRGEEVRAAAALVDQATAGFVPRVSGLLRYTRLSAVDPPSIANLVIAPTAGPGVLSPGAPLAVLPLSFPVILNQYVAQATVQLPVSDYFFRLPKLRAAAAQNAKAAIFGQEAARRAAAFGGRSLYYAWARATLEMSVANRAARQTRGHLKDAQSLQAVGTISKADVMRVESQVAAAELLVTRATAEAAVLDRQLSVLMHDPARHDHRIGEDLRDVPPDAPGLAADLVAPEATLVEEALAQRPEARALHESTGAARANAEAVRAVELPRIDAVANAVHARPNARLFPQEDRFSNTWDASAQLSWSPTDLWGARQITALPLHACVSSKSNGKGCATPLRSRSRRRGSRSSRRARPWLLRVEVSRLQEGYRVRRSLFVNGRATATELTDAENDHWRAQFEAIGARIDWRLGLARLVHALGRDGLVAGP